MTNTEQQKTSKNSFIENFKNNKKIQYISLIILFIILIIFVLTSVFAEKNNKDTSEFTIEKYIEDLETKLSDRLSKVEGAGKVSVIINIESGIETIVATEKTTTQNGNETITEEKPLLVNGKPIVVKEMFPKISGVLLIVEGGNSILVINRIQQATMSLLNIKISQIEILTGK